MTSNNSTHISNRISTMFQLSTRVGTGGSNHDKGPAAWYLPSPVLFFFFFFFFIIIPKPEIQILNARYKLTAGGALETTEPAGTEFLSLFFFLCFVFSVGSPWVIASVRCGKWRGRNR